MKNVGTWWNDKNIDLVEIDGRIFALYGWNGSKYCNCWECVGLDAGDERYILTPQYDDEFNVVNYDVELA